MGRDISNLIDPAVQDFIVQGSLYLREPQYKQIIRAGFLDFSFAPVPAVQEELQAALQWAPDPRDEACILRNTGGRSQVLGCLTMRTVNSAGLYGALQDAELANEVRIRTAGRIRLLTGLRVLRSPALDPGQLLLTEALSRAMEEDCGYAVWWGPDCPPQTLDLLERQGFVRINPDSERPLLVVDMRFPVALLQNIATTLKEPLVSDVLPTVREAHLRLQRAICSLYPGTLVLSLNAEVIYHRLVRKITALNGVPAEP